jgi:hypothetical protein
MIKPVDNNKHIEKLNKTTPPVFQARSLIMFIRKFTLS